MTSAKLLLASLLLAASTASAANRPNILLAISDDQSFPHASAYGSRMVDTPAFDRVAKKGALFTNAIAASPGCSPCRAALLTGRHTWQLGHAGTHASSFASKYTTYPELLEQAGYFVGYTGKGWGPGNWEIGGRDRNPAGPDFNRHSLTPPHGGIRRTDYAANFADFLKARPADRPFCFWYGASEPHRGFEKGVGLKVGKRLEQAEVPDFLPDTPEVRSDLLDYAVEIEWFDLHLGRILDQLEAAGELDNTLVIVTSDNGMSFPRAKANCYEFGIHMPLAVCFGDRMPSGRRIDDPVGFVDLTAAILDFAGVQPPERFPLAGRSIRNLLESDRSGRIDPSRQAVYSARERHSSSRYNNLGYPQRAIRTERYLYIRNFKPDRWPAGDPRKLDNNGVLGPEHGGYHDIDACPTLDFLVKHADHPELGKYLQLAVAKRPAEELYDIQTDPACLHNLADSHETVRRQLARQLDDYLKQTADPRALGDGDIWETYPRYSPIRTFPPSP